MKTSAQTASSPPLVSASTPAAIPPFYPTRFGLALGEITVEVCLWLIIYLLLPSILLLEQQFAPNVAAAAIGGIVFD